MASMIQNKVIALEHIKLLDSHCKNCGDSGSEHIIPDRHDQSRTRLTGKFGKCTKCDCKKFIPKK